MNNKENKTNQKSHRATREGWERPSERQTPEAWWAGLKPGARMLAQQIAVLSEEMTEDKRLEIRRQGEEIRVRFIHILKRPERGCLSAIIVPEVREWN